MSLSDLEKPLNSYVSSLNEKELSKVRNDDNSANPEGFLIDRYYTMERMFLLVYTLVAYIVIGGGYYCFPVWLNLILTEHVKLSDHNMSFLGGVPYTSLGIFGVVVLYMKTWGYSHTVEFFAGYAVTTVSALTCWGLLTWLVWTPDTTGHNIGVVALTLALIGIAPAGIFLIWFEYLLELVNLRFHVFYLALLNLAFVGGALLFLILKLYMPGREWISMILGLHIVVLLLFWPFLIWNHRKLIVSKPTPVTTAKDRHGAAIQLLKDLLGFRRQLKKDQLLTDACDVSSFQFWCMVLAYLGTNSLAATFMANIGPLTSHNADTEGNAHAEVIVIIWSTVGQILGRIFVPIFNNMVVQHLEKDSGRYINGDGDRLTTREQKPVHQSRINNRNVLGLTLLVGLIYFSGLIALKVSHSIQFVVATTILSAGYGMMWTVVSNFPLFFSNFGFSFFMSFFQAVGSLGTLVFTLSISLMQCDNTQIFTALLIATIVTLGVTLSGLISRIASEPHISR